ncbi:germinal-center associated nuclear protein [Archocentrus centrarchus]|uniref:germinal-center associated nuclear protein n=1 Tax=Archocentrus centrarchus TaxID=63155 RepID=UPI0011EA2120|nr:germinal-center associated nuclear protein [Archocentrus centrarchus]XP_030614654.1 germinal-center associated nuclear protein [Archocentrus centrarchus]
MNPPNPFGSPQGGAFQAPSSSAKPGLFPSFGPQSSSTQPPQSVNFFAQSAFGQPSPHGGNIFVQAPPFGQPQAPTFGPQSSGMSSSGFGGGPTPAFAQDGGASQGSVFGQAPFGQSSGFAQQPSGFASLMRPAGSQPQTLGFGPSAFGQPTPSSSSSSTSAPSTNLFGVGQNRGFVSSEFSFKPANEALFKPIFSASPEPANPQTTSLSSSAFGGSQTSSSATTTSSSFSLLSKSGPLGFSFSEPATAPSISSQSNPLTTGSSSGPATTLQFTFAQPATLSSSSAKAATTEPTTPSSFSFKPQTLQPQAAPVFGGPVFGHPIAFGDTKAKDEASTDDKAHAGQGEVSVFARLGKGTKRKDDPAVSGTAPEKPAAAEEDVPPEADSPRHPPKRLLMRSRCPPGGLFSRALSSLRKDGAKSVRQEAAKEPDREAVQTQGHDLSVTPPAAQTLTRGVQEKPEESESPKGSDPTAEIMTPVKRGVRTESSESLSGMSPTDCTTLVCKNVPPALNKKDTIEKHFARFGKVHKIYCRPAKNLTTVCFIDHASAAKAKKKGKILHGKELLLLWQRKKPSPAEKASRPATGTEMSEGESQEDTESKAGTSSPLRRPTPRPPALSSTVAFSRSSPVKKPSPVKVLQFDTEPQKESSTETQSSERPVPSSLLHLIGQVAETTEDKYRLLEQRDKILRQGRPKRTDLHLSKVFVGTCPDMCPEKERYMRETRNQLSVFEVIPNTEMVDHTAAIKEYSRSSADQEEPLPHELRPLPVLSMTMDYLVTQIMDQGHDKYRDWYDFVWNRTRGIRKDIIQQHLCCPQTVSLIEKCTRFHVHCAHHLCEEQLSSFDPKINNENMTKCLQSLKEMYQDLATRQIFCLREAEFRQYSVLLKLNDGDILREVQQFRDEVRNSPEVKFAVQAFAAVNSNNFVRFFKLVKGASYLASCLLHRYFNQVRAKALKTLNMAHTVGPRSTLFPLDDVVRMLMFRSAAEAADFIQQYGLNVNDGMVELSRIAYQEPELPLSQKKSEVTLTKRTVLIGEVVNGGPLPNPPLHTPVCSFDSQNKYRGEGGLIEPQFKAAADRTESKAPPGVELLPQVVPGRAPIAPVDETGEPSTHPAQLQQLFQPISQPARPPSPPPKPQLVYSDEDIMAELDGVIEEVVGAAVKEVAEAGASFASAALKESGAQVESLVNEVLRQMLQEVSTAEIKLEQERVAEEKRKLEEARRRQEHEAFLAQFSFSLCTEIIHEVLDETVKETATSEIQEALNEKAERVAKCTEQVCMSLVEETLNVDIAVLVEDLLEAELQRIHKYIKRWRDVVAVRRQLKRQMRGFPAAPCCVDPRFKLKALAPSAPARPSIADLARGLVNLGNAGMLALSSTRLYNMKRGAIHQMRVHYYFQQLLDETVWAPLDLSALVTENIPNPPERIFWKAVLLLPSNHESVASLADRILSDWLEVKLGGDKGSEGMEEKPEGTLQTLCVTNVLQDAGQRTHKVHISVKVSRGPLNEDSLFKLEECYELQGTSALIMLLPALPVVEPGQDEQDVPLLSALLQLKQLQQASTWHCPLPLVILVPGPEGGAADTQKLVETLMLHTLVKDGLISEYTFFFIPETTNDLQGSKQLNQAMRWLAVRAPPPFPLSCQTLVQLIESTLSHEFSPRVYAHRLERAAAHLPSQEPAPVVQLYNAVLAHVADKVSSQDLCRLSWPPGEFCLPDVRDFVPYLAWNSPQHLAWLREIILSLQLPQWEQLSAADSWSELCSSIFHYAAQIPVSRCSQPLLMSRLENLLERVKLNSQHSRIRGSKRTFGKSNNGMDDVCVDFSRIPWDDVLVICIDHKLKDWKIPEPPVCQDAVTEDGEILVYFLTESLKGFQPPEAWTEAIKQTHREKQQEEEGASAAACPTPTTASLRQRLFHTLVEPVWAPPAPLDITHTPTAQEVLAHKVLQSLEEEKAESKRNMEQLQRWVDGNPLEHLTTPLFLPSSTLLSMPTTITRTPTAKTREAAFTQEPSEPSGKVARPKTAPKSIALRLKELERQILASQEEELACRLKLSGMLSIVDD